jgi:hypothetical protein
MKRIDSLKPGDVVTLRFVGRWGNSTYEERMEFVGITGAGDDRRATFRTPGYANDDWDAYRFNGRWCYGTSADPLVLLEVES